MPIERVEIQDRDQWLAMRRDNVNASEVPIVCGEGAYGSLAELFAEKKGLRPPLVDSGVLRRGRWQEAAVFEALSDERPEWEVRRAKIYLRDSELRLGCTPDGFALAPDRPGRGVVQAKTVARSIFVRRWLEDPSTPVEFGDAVPPIYYVLQTLTEMFVSGSLWGVLAVIVSSEFDNTLRLFDIERDPEAEQRIVDNVDAFWRDYFDPGIMPPFDPVRDERLIKALFPKDDGTTVDLTADNRTLPLVEDLLEIGKGIKRLREQESAIKTELQGKLQGHTYGQLADGRWLQWKAQTRRAYSVAATTFRTLKVLKSRHTRPSDDQEEE